MVLKAADYENDVSLSKFKISGFAKIQRIHLIHFTHIVLFEVAGYKNDIKFSKF